MKALNRTFMMKDLGPARQILEMHIIQDRSKKQVWLSQERYMTKVLQQFNMLSTYRRRIRKSPPSNFFTNTQ